MSCIAYQNAGTPPICAAKRQLLAAWEAWSLAGHIPLPRLGEVRVDMSCFHLQSNAQRPVATPGQRSRHETHTHGPRDLKLNRCCSMGRADMSQRLDPQVNPIWENASHSGNPVREDGASPVQLRISGTQKPKPKNSSKKTQAKSHMSWAQLHRQSNATFQVACRMGSKPTE